nr:MAG: hypothetical protein E4H34_02185 [Hyphomicrobiales bacterium]
MSREHKHGEHLSDERKYWLDEPRNVDRLLYVLCAACVLLIVLDFAVPKHGLFAVEHYFGFYGVVGFVACAGIIWGATLLRRIIMRPEDYYDR